MQTQVIHPFEAAGLGKAPFRYVGMVSQEISYGMRVVNIKGANGATVACETKPGGTCDYCGTYIVNMFEIESADGKRFKVGCECVRKTGDSSLVKVVDAEVTRRKREQRAAKRVAQGEADKQLCLSTDLSPLAGKPHPTPARAERGETLADWARWMRDEKYYATLAAVIRRELRRN